MLFVLAVRVDTLILEGTLSENCVVDKALVQILLFVSNEDPLLFSLEAAFSLVFLVFASRAALSCYYLKLVGYPDKKAVICC
jgi:hypothetical protein